MDPWVSKHYADAKGKEVETSMDELIEIGIYNSKGKELYLEKVRLHSGLQTLKSDLPRTPSMIEIDPYHQIFIKGFLANQADIGKKE